MVILFLTSNGSCRCVTILLMVTGQCCERNGSNFPLSFRTQDGDRQAGDRKKEERKKRSKKKERLEEEAEEEGLELEGGEWEKVKGGVPLVKEKPKMFAKGTEINTAVVVKKLNEILQARGKKGTDR